MNKIRQVCVLIIFFLASVLKNVATDSTPPNIFAEAQTANDSLLPRSKEQYLVAYENFMKWKKNDDSFAENVFLDYFTEMAPKYKPSTLWSIYSMLKNTVWTKHGIDLKKYSTLIEFLKKRSEGFKSQKSKILTPNDVEKFLKEAPDIQYLATKVALIFAITGECGHQELINITTEDIENHGKTLLVRVTDHKNNMARSFTIQGPFLEIVKKYEALRSNKARNPRFFQNYQKGKCTSQPIGKNKFGAMAKQIARFLELPDANSYTGHSFRSTSAMMLVDSRADVVTLKRPRVRRSKRRGESSVEDSINTSLSHTEHKLTQAINSEPGFEKIHLEPCPSTSYVNNVLVPPSTAEELGHTSTSYETISSSSAFTATENNEAVWFSPEFPKKSSPSPNSFG